MVILLVMGMELSDEVLQASQLAHDLRESEKRLSLAADTAHLGLWVWDVTPDEIWTTPKGRASLGVTATERLDRHRFFAAVHPDDRDVMQQVVEESLRADTDYEAEYRVNVVKHSGANAAKVELTGAGNGLHLVVSDQGRGFDPAKNKGGSSLGLVSMHERVRLVHGHISVQSRSGEGTRILVQVPLEGLHR